MVLVDKSLYFKYKTFENMKKTKIENISDIKLDFFLRQNKEDVRVVLNPGEISWCDEGTTTKSMLLYEYDCRVGIALKIP